ncbi:hypothetical protein [Natronoarchaeum mannanilyticum]|uniref:Uncharacterized protein n=1 Tax=Natronoarchaeum mannanilyticum TaxID=926360 RepID=A0AAV3TA89_9EURY
MPDLLLQSATGGSVPVVAAALIGQTIAFALACWIVYRAASGYRASRAPALLWLAVGVALLSAAPTAARVLLPTFTSAPVVTVRGVALVGEVLGLTAILYAIYGKP